MNRKIRLGLALSAALACAAGAGGRQLGPRIHPRAYGISEDSVYRIPASEFVPRDSTTVWTEDGFPGVLARYTSNCLGACLAAVPHLPDGAVLTGIEAYFCNVNSDPLNGPAVFLYNANYDGTNITDLNATVASQSHNGCGESEFLDLSSLNYQVNYYNNELIVLADFEETTGTQAIAGVKLFYRLQVSPAPPTSDFSDVSTSNPQFQFIEALYGSGITVGCGDGKYCPDAALTRGQMAVFLAKALGLQWP